MLRRETQMSSLLQDQEEDVNAAKSTKPSQTTDIEVTPIAASHAQSIKSRHGNASSLPRAGE